MNNENLKNNLSEREVLSADEQKVCDLIGKLDRVDCPKDFNFHLKARIANSNKSEYEPSVWQTLRYIVPVAACVLIVAFVMVQAGMFSPASQTETTIASTTNPNIQPFDERSNSSQIFTAANSSEPIIAAVPNRNSQPGNLQNTDVSLNNSAEPKTTFPKLSREDEPTMSKDFGVGQNRKPINPRGINPDQILPNKIEIQNDKSVPVKDVLDIFGISTEAVSGKLRVKNVRANTLADKAGIKAGDFIESIGNTKIIQSEMTLKSDDFGKITVSRDGKIIVFNFQPN